MMRNRLVKPWMIAAMFAVFLSACATSEDQIIDDGTGVDDGTGQTGVVDDGLREGVESRAPSRTQRRFSQ